MTYLLASLIYLFSILTVPAQEAILHVFVHYDSNHDGIEEGVGPGIPVYVGGAGAETLNFTDQNSQAAYIVQYGAVFARAEVKPTRPFFVWICGNFGLINEPEEDLVIRCYERFVIRFPFLKD